MKPCLTCGVPTTGTYCTSHAPAPWAGSDRRARLPRDWPRRRRRILRRDPVCRCPGCRHHNGPCTQPSTDVDHRIAGDDHSDSNLQGLCSMCHATKTGSERTPLGHAPLTKPQSPDRRRGLADSQIDSERRAHG